MPSNKWTYVYYQLKQVDFNSDFEFSNIEALANNEMKIQALKLFPNPASNQVIIQSEEGGMEMITLFDASGSLLRIYDDVNPYEVKLDTKDILDGIYLLQITSQQGVQSKRFVIQH